eukprot:SAG25_NODE_1988_length_2056_cov_1.365866_2_plen_66_part_00
MRERVDTAPGVPPQLICWLVVCIGLCMYSFASMQEVVLITVVNKHEVVGSVPTYFIPARMPAVRW